jgi:Tfp pilus assembly protein PilO
MLRSFNLDYSLWPLNNAGAITRLVLAVLLAGNLVALYFVVRPPGGSPQELKQQLSDLRGQVKQRQAVVDRTRILASKIEAGRSQGEQFLLQYFLPRRLAYSTILAELSEAALQSKVRPKESSYGTEPVDGTDNYSLMQISANFEGKYEDLIQFVNLLDKSKRLLIIEGLNATPEQGSPLLNVNVKLDTFVTEEAPGL